MIRSHGALNLLALGLMLSCLAPSFVAAQDGAEEPQDAAPDAATSTWQQQGGDFAAMLVLTRHGEELRQAWSRPTDGPAAAEIRATEQAIPGETFEAVVIFSGCQGDDTGHCNAHADFALLAPDGSRQRIQERTSLWNAAPPNAGALRLGQASLTATLDPSDPLGTYRVATRVCDAVAEICLNLQRELEVLSPADAVDLNALLHTYYLDPRPLLIQPAMHALQQSGILDDPNARAPVIAFFGLVMARHPEYAEGWKQAIASLEGSTQAALQTAANLSQQPTFLVDDHPPSPGHNDMLWGAYFASGDGAFLETIVQRLEHLPERLDANLFLTASSAQWSLAANAANHSGVERALRDLLPRITSKTIAQGLQEALTTSPEAIRETMTAVLSEQQAAGVW